MRWRDWLPAAAAIAIIVFAVLLFMACAGHDAPLDAAVHLLVGWFLFARRVAPHISIDSNATATAVASIIFLVAGTHWFLRWLATSWKTSVVRGQGTSNSPIGYRTWRLRRTVAIIGSVVLMFVAGVSMIGLTHQVAWLLRSPRPWTQPPVMERSWASDARNRLRNSGFALLSHAQVHGALPSGGTTDANGQMLHGWQTLILPYLEHRALFDRIDLTRPWNGPENADVFKTSIDVYHAKEFDSAADYTQAGFAISDFAGNILLIGPEGQATIESITDGASNTILVGEVTRNRKAWGDPTNWRDPRDGLNKSDLGFGGPWRDGSTHVLMADGSVRRLSAETDLRVLEALATPASGDMPPGME